MRGYLLLFFVALVVLLFARFRYWWLSLVPVVTVLVLGAAALGKAIGVAVDAPWTPADDHADGHAAESA
jgi:hypothetical protein